MASLEAVHAAIQLIYEAVLAPQQWDRVAAQLVEMTRADRTFFIAAGTRQPTFVVSNLDPGNAIALQREMLTRVPAWMKRIPVGTARKQTSEVSDCNFRRSYIYRHAVGPEGMFYGLVLPVTRSPGRESYLTIGRHLGAKDFTPEDEASTTMLGAHLGLALGLRARLAATDMRDDRALDILMRLDFGVILLDGSGRPVFLNDFAQKLSNACDGLLISHRGVSTPDLEEAQKLQAAIDCAVEFGNPGKSNDMRLFKPTRCYLHRRRQRLPLMVQVMPAKCCDSSAGASALMRVILFVFDPARRSELDLNVVADAYSLTPREIELAALLARGLDLSQAARQMRIGEETARGYLKVVQGKTGTHRQAELVSLLLGGGDAGAPARQRSEASSRSAGLALQEIPEAP